MLSLRFASVLFLLLSAAAVRLLYPTAAAGREFSFTNLSLFLTVPYHLIPSLSGNRSAAALWVQSHVLPYHPRSRIAFISARSDVITPSPTFGPSAALLPAMRNIRLALLDFGVRTIFVSDAFSSIDVVTTPFPPSAAKILVVRPLLQFLDETNSSLLINLYPYNIHQINSKLPVGFVLLRRGPLSFHDDEINGVMYHNLFDMVIDAIEAAMAVSGEENVIVEETGWPSDPKAAAEIYAEIYLQGLLKHLRSGPGTPLRKLGAHEAYVYEGFDESTQWSTSNNTTDRNGYTAMSGGGAAWKHGGIMYPNMTTKYNADLSNSKRILKRLTNRLVVALLILMVMVGWNIFALLLNLLIDLIR